MHKSVPNYVIHNFVFSLKCEALRKLPNFDFETGYWVY